VYVLAAQVFIQELHAFFKGTADVWAISNLGEEAGWAVWYSLPPA